MHLGGAPTIFWGSYEPRAGCLLPTENPHRLASVPGCEKRGRAIDRGRLNGVPAAGIV